MTTTVAPAVDVIVPTTGSPARSTSLRRAIGSIRRAASRQVRIVVVLNGGKHDRALSDWLLQQPDVHCVFEQTASLPHALYRGRECVVAPYFSTLDDDDEYLEGAIDLRLEAMAGHKDAALVVTNGYKQSAGIDEILYSHLARVAQQPLNSLFEANWLNSANALYRSSAISIGDFSEHNAYAEWTWLAFRLAMTGRKIVTLDAPTFRIHDTPDSLSKSDSYVRAYMLLYQRMLDCSPPAIVRRLILRKMSAAWHDFSVKALHEQDKPRAWACHFRSLTLPGGLSYALYTRRLLPGWPNQWRP